MIIDNFCKANVLVIGDVMLDRYWSGVADRISPEAPVPVINVANITDILGGSANVAANIKSLGASVSLAGIIGQDDTGVIIENILHSKNIQSHLKSVSDIRTITKIRIVSSNQQLLRTDFDNFLPSYANISGYIDCISQAQALVLSDYGKGTLVNCETLIAAAIKVNIPILIDPKGTNFTQYTGATVITPNLSEFEAVVGECKSSGDIVSKATSLILELKIQAVLITMGGKGMMLVYRDNLSSSCKFMHYPAYAKEIFDVTGAGDTVIATCATALAVGNDMPTAVKLANVAASIAVEKFGTTAVTAKQLQNKIHDLQYSFCDSILTEEKLFNNATEAKERGETLVMTNGCFDIMHAGHVAYLEQARALGNRLIVVVNDDESVKKIKGNQRPIYSLEQRINMLSALKAVDWVIPFSDSTPENLIRKIQPDILVKGGDYKNIAAVVGSDIVLGYGGQVIILDEVKGCSTSATLDKLLAP